MTAVENDLRTMAHRVLSEAKQEMEQRGAANHAFIFQRKDGFLKLEIPEEFGDLMNIGKAKDAIFSHMRQYAQEKEAMGCIFVSEAWMSRATEKGRKLSMKEIMRLHQELGGEELAKRGLMERVEALVITAQSAESVLTLTQPFERDQRLKIVTFGPLIVQEVPQAQFAGRQKMFGDLSPENIQ